MEHAPDVGSLEGRLVLSFFLLSFLDLLGGFEGFDFAQAGGGDGDLLRALLETRGCFSFSAACLVETILA